MSDRAGVEIVTNEDKASFAEFVRMPTSPNSLTSIVLSKDRLSSATSSFESFRDTPGIATIIISSLYALVEQTIVEVSL